MTTRRSDLPALAERVRNAAGADRGLDEAIYRALGYWWDSAEAEWCAPDSPRAAEGAEPPLFTASLDAALTLVPDGRTWYVQSNPGLKAHWGIVHHARPPSVFGGEVSKAATPALALCAAALLALAEDTGDE